VFIFNEEKIDRKRYIVLGDWKKGWFHKGYVKLHF